MKSEKSRKNRIEGNIICARLFLIPIKDGPVKGLHLLLRNVLSVMPDRQCGSWAMVVNSKSSLLVLLLLSMACNPSTLEFSLQTLLSSPWNIFGLRENPLLRSSSIHTYSTFLSQMPIVLYHLCLLSLLLSKEMTFDVIYPTWITSTY